MGIYPKVIIQLDFEIEFKETIIDGVNKTYNRMESVVI
jgi:hypothetical protein